MVKPKTKDELLKACQRNFKLLNALVDSYSDQDKEGEFPMGTLNRNIRDVLAHLHHWHLLLLDWYNEGMNNGKPEMPARGYSWKEITSLNRAIREEYNKIPLEEVRNMLIESYSKVQKIINRHSDDELFEKKRYKWTGSTSLGAYIIANTSSHYTWAYNLIRKAKK